MKAFALNVCDNVIKVAQWYIVQGSDTTMLTNVPVPVKKLRLNVFIFFSQQVIESCL